MAKQASKFEFIRIYSSNPNEVIKLYTELGFYVVDQLIDENNDLVTRMKLSENSDIMLCISENHSHEEYENKPSLVISNQSNDERIDVIEIVL